MADKQRFAELLLPLMDQLYAQALRLTRNRADAEDVLQEAYMRAYRSFATFEEGTNLRAWMGRILLNAYINRFNKAAREPSSTELDDVEELFLYRRLGSIDPATRSAEDLLFDRFTSDEVNEAVHSLPEAYRVPVLLADVDGYSYREIAAMLDVPIGTVMSRLHRGRRLLQRNLYDFAVREGLVLAPASGAVDKASTLEPSQS